MHCGEENQRGGDQKCLNSIHPWKCLLKTNFKLKTETINARAKPGVWEVLHDGVRVGLEEFNGGDEAGIFGEILCPRIPLQLGEDVRGVNRPFETNLVQKCARNVSRIILRASTSLNSCVWPNLQEYPPVSGRSVVRTDLLPWRR